MRIPQRLKENCGCLERRSRRWDVLGSSDYAQQSLLGASIFRRWHAHTPSLQTLTVYSLQVVPRRFLGNNDSVRKIMIVLDQVGKNLNAIYDWLI